MVAFVGNAVAWIGTSFYHDSDRMVYCSKLTMTSRSLPREGHFAELYGCTGKLVVEIHRASSSSNSEARLNTRHFMNTFIREYQPFQRRSSCCASRVVVCKTMRQGEVGHVGTKQLFLVIAFLFKVNEQTERVCLHSQTLPIIAAFLFDLLLRFLSHFAIVKSLSLARFAILALSLACLECLMFKLFT